VYLIKLFAANQSKGNQTIALKHFSITVLIGIALVVFIACTKENTPYGHVDGNKTPSPDPLTDFGSAIFRGVQGGLTRMVLTNDPPSIKQLENEPFLKERVRPIVLLQFDTLNE
jgi:hypothetical protein